MSSDAAAVEFRTMIESTCSINQCHRDARHVAIVTGEFGTDCLAAYCPACADAHAESSLHTFIGEVQG